MSTLATTNIKHASSSSNNIVLGSDGSTSISGHILQVIQGTTNSIVTTSSTSWVATNLSASITPASTSNKVYVSANISLWQSTNDQSTYLTIFRSTDGGSNWTNLGDDDGSNGGVGFGWHYSSTDRLACIQTMNILDSPSSTSAVQYKVYFRLYASTGSASIPTGGAISRQETNRIHLMEVAA